MARVGTSTMSAGLINRLAGSQFNLSTMQTRAKANDNASTIWDGNGKYWILGIAALMMSGIIYLIVKK